MTRYAAAKEATERQAPSAPARSAPRAQPLLALQRAAGNAALGQYLRRSRARHVARCGGGSCGCAACSTAAPVRRPEDEDELADA